MSIASADLKTQGNALFAAKKYGQADKKYTGAIESSTDPKELAVLYANRAACRLSLKRFVHRNILHKALHPSGRYMDADTDATKVSTPARGIYGLISARQATQLDPTYAKAFARLASAQDVRRATSF
jgi:stress-induced-phosphoprotein 1